MVDYYWECHNCKDTFETADRIDSDEGEYNCCPFCQSVDIEKIWTVQGMAETFDTEDAAIIAELDGDLQ